MLVSVLLFLFGLGLLAKGGDWFVDAAAALARRFRLPEILIGSTIVSIGTTLPEVMVSTASALSSHGEMAYGNAIGSVICNTALVAAVSAAVHPGPADAKSLRLPAAFFTLAAVLFAGVAYTTGMFSRGAGLLLLGVFAGYLFFSLRRMRAAPSAPAAETGGPAAPIGKVLAGLVGGAAAIAVGADLLVDHGTVLAAAIGVPESVIALTFVALGTSLPELVTAITALAKGHSALSLGNVIGANFLNLTLVTGTAAVLAPFGVPQGRVLCGVNRSLALDLPVLALVSALLILPTLRRSRMTRPQGIALLTLYAAFCVGQFV